MIEKLWASVAPVQLTAAGGARGLVTVTSTIGFRVKMAVTIQDGANAIPLEVKRVVNETQMFLGEQGENIGNRSNLTAFPIGSIVFSKEQPRNNIPLQEIERAVYEEEPVVALRTIGVDLLGRPYSVDNPLPVQLSDGSINIETLNANLAVQLSHLDNYPKPGDVHDSVRIGGSNGTEMWVNTDGSINVNIVQSPDIPGLIHEHDEVALVPAGSETTILSYVAGMGGFRATRISVSGENVALIRVKVNGDTVETRRFYWTEFTTDFVFENIQNGLKLSPGDTISVTVYHTRPMAGAFEATLYGI